MSESASPASFSRTSVALCVIGAAMAAGSWGISQATLAEFFQHPARANALAHALDSAAAARVGWTAIGMSLCVFPWIVQRIGGARTTSSPSAAPADFSKPLRLLLVLSLFVRMIRVGESLWYDEIAALATYVVHGPGVIMGNAFTTANHPLQSLLSWLSMWASVDPGIRLPSILAGPVAVWGVWSFARQVAADRTALIAAGAMAFAPAAVLASGEARGYALSIALGAWASSMMLSMLRGTSHRLTPLWYALVMALATWAHLVTACLALGHFLVALWMLRSRERHMAAVTAIAAVLWAGLISLGLWSPALPDLFHTREQFFAITGNEPRFFKDGRVSDEAVMLVAQFGGTYFAPALMALPLASWGLAAALRRPDLRLAVAVAGLGVPVALLAAWLGNSWLYARFLLFDMTAAAFLIALGLSSAWNFRRWIAIIWMAFIGLAWLGQILTLAPKQPLREAIEYVAANKAPNDTVATITPADNVGQWYALAHGFELLPTGQYGSELEECLRSTPPPRWIVMLYPQSIDRTVLEALRRDNYTCVELRRGWVDWNKGYIAIYERNSDQPPISLPRGSLF